MGLDSIPLTKQGYVNALELFTNDTSEREKADVYAAMDPQTLESLRRQFGYMRAPDAEDDADPTTWNDNRFVNAAIVLSEAARLEFVMFDRDERLDSIRNLAGKSGVYPSVLRDTIVLSDFQAGFMDRARKSAQAKFQSAIDAASQKPKPRPRKRAKPAAEKSQNAA